MFGARSCRLLCAVLLFAKATGAAACSGNAGERGSSREDDADAGATLTSIRQRGALRCGVAQSTGFAVPDAAGRWQGFEVDLCRALAVALFNDTERGEFVPYTMQQRFSGLQSREVDVLLNGSSKTITRSMQRGFHFGPVYLYDSQGLLISRALNVTSIHGLDGAAVCVQQGTTTELNLTDLARREGIQFRPVVIEDLRTAVSALQGGRCDAISQDLAGLATTRLMLRDPENYVLLDEHISKEPIAPVLRFGDDQWFEIVQWVIFALIQAEEFGIGKSNLEHVASRTDPAIRRFLGLDPGVTDGMGLDPRWTWNVIQKVGNYGEIYARHLGHDTPMDLPRNLNRLWSEGGLLYAPPFR